MECYWEYLLRCSSGAVSTVTCVYASISASTTALDTTHSIRIPTVGYNVGATANTYLNMPMTRNRINFYSNILFVHIFFGAGSFNAQSYSVLNALRIA